MLRVNRFPSLVPNSGNMARASTASALHAFTAHCQSRMAMKWGREYKTQTQTKEPGTIRGETETGIHSQSSRTQMLTDDYESGRSQQRTGERLGAFLIQRPASRQNCRMKDLSKGAHGNPALSLLWMENLGNRDWKTLPIPLPTTSDPHSWGRGRSLGVRVLAKSYSPDTLRGHTSQSSAML